ncbi:hypothetical protein IFM89_038223 [Coptis chinensis]|uniref:Uncharacterized protein n=1 Tax=Coptis chinensis TaxID=261450 RepID=A0A835M2Y6_9MAGN|nr:hypothetical protein IFM89_038223 [Coptis chinensis]
MASNSSSNNTALQTAHIHHLISVKPDNRHPEHEEDLQQIILGGLNVVYEAIVTTLTARMFDINMEDFFTHFLAFDMRLEAQIALLQQQTVANVAAQYRNLPTQPRSNQNRSRPNYGNQYRN